VTATASPTVRTVSRTVSGAVTQLDDALERQLGGLTTR
jgi:hypothetical protein